MANKCLGSTPYQCYDPNSNTYMYMHGKQGVNAMFAYICTIVLFLNLIYL